MNIKSQIEEVLKRDGVREHIPGHINERGEVCVYVDAAYVTKLETLLRGVSGIVEALEQIKTNDYEFNYTVINSALTEFSKLLQTLSRGDADEGK